MVKKLSLEDLKVQSFVMELTEEDARRIVGGTDPSNCGTVVCCGLSYHSSCCDPSLLTDAGCGCSGPSTPCGYCTSNTNFC